jgi:hypothetical protein
MSASVFGQKLAVVVFALTFYCLGTTYFEAFVNYRTWPFIGAGDFRTYHQALTPLVVRVMLVPIAVDLACLLILLVLRPATIPLWAIAASLALLGTAIVSSAFIQIPIQGELSRLGLSMPLIERLIATDIVLRKIPLGMNAFLWLYVFMTRRA